MTFNLTYNAIKDNSVMKDVFIDIKKTIEKVFSRKFVIMVNSEQGYKVVVPEMTKDEFAMVRVVLNEQGYSYVSLRSLKTIK